MKFLRHIPVDVYGSVVCLNVFTYYYPAKENSTTQMCYKLFIHFPVDEHLVCFQCLVTINKAPVIFSFLLGKYFRVEWLCYLVSHV